MSDPFQWHTEEDAHVWDAPEAPGGPAARRRWPWLLLLALLLGVGGLLGMARLGRQVTAVSTSVTRDVLATHAAVRRAAAAADADLFRALLSASRPDWTQAQQFVFQRGQLLARPAFGLAHTPAASALISVTVAPDLRAAEVTFVETYADGAGAAVRLRQTAVYRQGRTRWLLAPPPADFWGAEETARGRYVSLTYPARDAALARRLLADLDAQVAAVCTDWYPCPDGLALRVRLESDPALLVEMGQPARVLRPRAEMALPAPTLVGWPADEAAYAALRRGYAIPVVAAVAGQAVGWTGEGGGRLHQAFVDLLLAELGLRDWPLAPAAYAALFDGPLDSLERVVREWALPPAALDAGDGWRDAYAVVAFIVAAHPAERLATLHRRLAVAPDATAWLRRHNVAARDAAAQKAWLRFVAAEMETAVAPAPPAQAVQVMCNPSLGERATLYRYDVAADSWQSEVSGYYWVFMNPLPDDSGVLLQAWQPRSQGSVGMVWQGGELRDVFRQAINVHLFRVDAVQARAAGDRLQLFEYDFGQNQAQVSVLDLGTCDEAGCAQVGLQAQPVWSPGGEQTLQMLPMGSLWLGDGRGQMTALVNQGRAPFWLDEETYGFARRQRVMRARLDGGATETLLDLGEWGTAVGLDEFAVVSIVRSAYNADWLYILLELADGAPLVVIHDMARQTTRSFRLAGALGPYNPLFTSPDGRWITVRTFETDGPGWQLHLVDAATGETRALRSGHPTSFPGFDWSADGEWLVMVRDGFLLLLAPADDYRQLIVHDFPECDFAGWVN